METGHDKDCPCLQCDSHRRHLIVRRRETDRRNQAKRQAAQLAAAQRDGFATASEAITAWMRGEVVMVKK